MTGADNWPSNASSHGRAGLAERLAPKVLLAERHPLRVERVALDPLLPLYIDQDHREDLVCMSIKVDS